MGVIDYDLIIVGGGPAGLTAGLFAARARMKVVLLEKIVPGGQILVTDWIENYPGFPDGLSGADLVQKMTQQAQNFGLPIESDEVLGVDLSGSVKKVVLSNKTLTCHALIIASGASPKKLGVSGEDRFLGKGISFCATCDGPFFKDSIIAAVGGGDTAVQESIYLTKFAKKVYLIHRRDQLRAVPILQERAFANDKIELLWDSVITRIDGSQDVESVSVQNVKTGRISTLPVDGCFVWIGILPNTSFLTEHLDLDEFGFIPTNDQMETSVAGVYAAGDVRSTRLRQIATAVGDAATAAYSAQHHIENIDQ